MARHNQKLSRTDCLHKLCPYFVLTSCYLLQQQTHKFRSNSSRNNSESKLPQLVLGHLTYILLQASEDTGYQH